MIAAIKIAPVAATAIRSFDPLSILRKIGCFCFIRGSKPASILLQISSVGSCCGKAISGNLASMASHTCGGGSCCGKKFFIFFSFSIIKFKQGRQGSALSLRIINYQLSIRAAFFLREKVAIWTFLPKYSTFPLPLGA